MIRLAGPGVPCFLDAAPGTAKLLGFSALLADTVILLIEQPVMDALNAIAIQSSLLILHLNLP
jgi:hypothetical protein